MDHIERGRQRGLAIMNAVKIRAGRKAQTGGAVKLKAGRPKARRMAHEALHEALMGLAKA